MGMRHGIIVFFVGYAICLTLQSQDLTLLDQLKVPRIKTPATIAFEQQPIRVKVLVLEFNPVIPGEIHSPDNPEAKPKTLREVAGWLDPLKLAADYMQDICDASGGFVQYEIVAWDIVNEFQMLTDGFTYTPSSYMKAFRAWGKGNNKLWHKPDGTDYPASIRRYGLIKRVESGEVDEVWWFGAPYMGWWEASMAGRKAFNVNGGVYDQVPCKRAFVIMGFNYEREVNCMLEDLCHRAEATMSHFYGGWEVDKLTTDWARFAANAKQSNGIAAVGTCHYPPNGEHDYDYDNQRIVQSSADDWLNYPQLKGIKKSVNCEAWGGPDYHRNYLKWWFTRLPKTPGVNKDGRQNNWWKYVFNFNGYNEQGKSVKRK